MFNKSKPRSATRVQHWQEGHEWELPKCSGKLVLGGWVGICSRLCPWHSGACEKDAERWWKMTGADKHASNSLDGRQKHGQHALFNLFAGLFLPVVLTADMGEHVLRKLPTLVSAGHTIKYENAKVLLRVQWNNTTPKGKINGLTRDGCLFWLHLTVEFT